MAKTKENIADIASGVGWILFGVLIIVLSLQMEIREHLGGTFLSGPGFVPMLLGGALCVLGLVLIARGSHGKVMAFLDRSDSVSDKAAIGALALMLVYSVGMVGQVPFGLATFLFIATFIVAFNLPVDSRSQFAKLVAKAVATAAITSIVVVFVFRELFYIRLP